MLVGRDNCPFKRDTGIPVAGAHLPRGRISSKYERIPRRGYDRGLLDQQVRLERGPESLRTALQFSPGPLETTGASNLFLS